MEAIAHTAGSDRRGPTPSRIRSATSSAALRYQRWSGPSQFEPASDSRDRAIPVAGRHMFPDDRLDLFIRQPFRPGCSALTEDSPDGCTGLRRKRQSFFPSGWPSANLTDQSVRGRRLHIDGPQLLRLRAVNAVRKAHESDAILVPSVQRVRHEDLAARGNEVAIVKTPSFVVPVHECSYRHVRRDLLDRPYPPWRVVVGLGFRTQDPERAATESGADVDKELCYIVGHRVANKTRIREVYGCPA